VSNRSNARSQLLERDVARLFTEKVEIFTKLEYNQVSLPGSNIDIYGRSSNSVVFFLDCFKAYFQNDRDCRESAT
jgi:hypothetical protein